MNKQWMLPAAVFLLIAVAAWAVLQAGGDETGPGAEPAPGRAEASGLPSAAEQVPSPVQAAGMTANRALPPVDVPLAQVIDDLKRRADRGEANAACRLAAEWTYCKGLQQRVQSHEYVLRTQERRALRLAANPGRAQAGMSAGMLERGIDNAQAQLDRSRQQFAHCDGVGMPRPDEIVRYWRQAALAGHLPAMRNYAVGNAFRRNEALDNLPALAVYRQEAVKIARAAVDRGDLRTALALAGAYSPLTVRNGTYLSQLVEPDAGEALALLYRIDDLIGRSDLSKAQPDLRPDLAISIEELEAAMSPQDIRTARTRAAGSPPLAADAGDLHNLFAGAGGVTADLPREECEVAAGRRPR